MRAHVTVWGYRAGRRLEWSGEGCCTGGALEGGGVTRSWWGIRMAWISWCCRKVVGVTTWPHLGHSDVFVCALSGHFPDGFNGSEECTFFNVIDYWGRTHFKVCSVLLHFLTGPHLLLFRHWSRADLSLGPIFSR